MPQEKLGSRVDQALATPEASIPAQLPWTDASVSEEVRDALAAPIGPPPADPVSCEPAPTPSEPSPLPRGETRELARRVQALERLLQKLLAQLAKSEPDLLARLEESFSASVQTARPVDDEDIDACAAALIQAVRHSAGEEADSPAEVGDVSPPKADARRGDRHKDEPVPRQPTFRYRKVGGIWRLTMERPPRAAVRRDEDVPAGTAAPPGTFTPPPAPSGSSGSVRPLPPAGRRSSP